MSAKHVIRAGLLGAIQRQRCRCLPTAPALTFLPPPVLGLGLDARMRMSTIGTHGTAARGGHSREARIRGKVDRVTAALKTKWLIVVVNEFWKRGDDASIVEGLRRIYKPTSLDYDQRNRDRFFRNLQKAVEANDEQKLYLIHAGNPSKANRRQMKRKAHTLGLKVMLLYFAPHTFSDHGVKPDEYDALIVRSRRARAEQQLFTAADTIMRVLRGDAFETPEHTIVPTPTPTDRTWQADRLVLAEKEKALPVLKRISQRLYTMMSDKLVQPPNTGVDVKKRIRWEAGPLAPSPPHLLLNLFAQRLLHDHEHQHQHEGSTSGTPMLFGARFSAGAVTPDGGVALLLSDIRTADGKTIIVNVEDSVNCFLLFNYPTQRATNDYSWITHPQTHVFAKFNTILIFRLPDSNYSEISISPE